ncbi:MAG: GNAT family N-acetyltransferase [Chlamydiales bacterium]
MAHSPMTNTDTRYKIRRMELSDVAAVAAVHAQSFSRQLNSEEWILCNFRAYPRIRIFVAYADNEIVGYIQWTEKSGFRKEVVLELEQIAVLPESRNQGIGSNLINSSLSLVKEELATREAVLKHIIVTTRTDNSAQKIYRETLNASAETTISDLFSADEVIMIVRDISKQKESKQWNQ